MISLPALRRNLAGVSRMNNLRWATNLSGETTFLTGVGMTNRPRQMPAGLIDEKRRVCARRDLSGDF